MDYIVRPKIRATGGKAVSGQEAWQDRLLKYIPLSIAGAYPLLENGIAEFVKRPIAGLSPSALIWIVFALLVLWYVLFLHLKFGKTSYKTSVRFRLQAQQTAVSILAFCVWTYSVKSAIWQDIYHPGLAIITTVMFLLFAGLYEPSITPEESQGK